MAIFGIIFCSLALLVVIVVFVKVMILSREIDKTLDDLERKLDYMKKGI